VLLLARFVKGWSEADILAMPIERRNTYVQVITELNEEAEADGRDL
jgi:hypothetical protein